VNHADASNFDASAKNALRLRLHPETGCRAAQSGTAPQNAAALWDETVVEKAG
jgi:hypothetical protein